MTQICGTVFVEGYDMTFNSTDEQIWVNDWDWVA